MEEVKIIPIESWSAHLNLILTDNVNDCIRSQAEIKGFKPDKYILEGAELSYDGVVMDFEEEGLSGTVMFLIYDKIDDRLIVHEVSHAVFHILDKRGVILNEHTTEAFAYLEEYLFDQTQKFFLEVKQRIDFNPQPELPLIWQEEK